MIVDSSALANRWSLTLSLRRSTARVNVARLCAFFAFRKSRRPHADDAQGRVEGARDRRTDKLSIDIGPVINSGAKEEIETTSNGCALSAAR